MVLPRRRGRRQPRGARRGSGVRPVDHRRHRLDTGHQRALPRSARPPAAPAAAWAAHVRAQRGHRGQQTARRRGNVRAERHRPVPPRRRRAVRRAGGHPLGRHQRRGHQARPAARRDHRRLPAADRPGALPAACGSSVRPCSRTRVPGTTATRATGCARRSTTGSGGAARSTASPTSTRCCATPGIRGGCCPATTAATTCTPTTTATAPSPRRSTSPRSPGPGEKNGWLRAPLRRMRHKAA